MATITHVGGPTTLIEVEGWRILTDPTFDPPGRTYGFGWGTSSRKTTGPALTAEQVGPVDVVLVSHDGHADNLDDAGRLLLSSAGATAHPTANPTVVTTVPGARRLGRGAQGVRARGLRAWQTTRLEAPGRPALTVTATPCRHGPPGSRPIVGAVIGFALAWEGQRHGALWISGDTVLYRGVREVAERLDVGAAVLHLGGVRFPITGPLRYSMTGADAVELCAAMRPRTVLPVHYEGWSHFAQGRAELAAELSSPAMVAPVVWPTPGVPLDVDV